MSIQLGLSTRSWQLREAPVRKNERIDVDVIMVTLSFDGHLAVGEAVGMEHETTDKMLGDAARVRAAIEGGINRRSLLSLLPPGGARSALDAALWDLEAKLSGVPVWEIAGLPRAGVARVPAVQVLEADGPGLEQRARDTDPSAVIKVVLGETDAIDALRAVRRAAPGASLIVDARRRWSLAELADVEDALAELRVALLYRPVKVHDEGRQIEQGCAIPLCADPLIAEVEDLPRLAAGYQAVAFDLDRAGGLTNAIAYARAARRSGLKVLLTSRRGGSLSVAPAQLLAASADLVDFIDIAQGHADWHGALLYREGALCSAEAQAWGKGRKVRGADCDGGFHPAGERYRPVETSRLPRRLLFAETGGSQKRASPHC